MGTTNYSDLLRQKSKKFYTDSSTLSAIETIKNEYKDLSEKIQLKVSINKIKSDYTYKIKLFHINNYEKISLNQIVDCINKDDETIILNTPIIIRYYFEKEQPLLIEIIRANSEKSNSYKIETTVGHIMGSRKNTLIQKIYSSENETETEILTLQGEKLRQSEDIVSIKFKINSEKKVSFKEIKNKMYYEIKSDTLLYRSECLNDEGIFENVKIPVGLFKDNMINIIFYNSSRKSCGNFNLNLLEFTNDKLFEINVKGNKFIILSKSILTKSYTFVDYLYSGIEIGLSVAIDFTNSNGCPKDERSLHYIQSNKLNQYERAIISCGNILAYYDYDQLFPCFGFGAKVNNRPRSLFNLNFQSDPNVKFVEGIIEAYHHAIKVVTLYGPTYFAPIIKEMNKIIKNEDNNLKYHILLILTDGKIDDIDNTIDELVEGSFLPLSIIIIGLGNADFTNMVFLDHDNDKLVNSKGAKASRDLVQFVPFLKYEANPELLAIEVLEEIPRQIVDYYEQNNIDPYNLAL